MWRPLILFTLATQVCFAFKVYWNVPSERCKNVRPDKYNITTNEGRKFRGDKLVIFYEPDLGLYPYCLPGPNDTKTFCENMINGGVPQAVDMEAHLIQLRLDIQRGIPDPDFDGLVIIDWERWRPLFDLNWSRREFYKEYSIKLIMDKYPKITKYTATYVARFTFDKAAKEMFVRTMEVAKETRPKAKWTYWDYPLCNYDVAYNGDLRCKPQFDILNEQLLWLHNVTDFIVPQSYFYIEKHSPQERMRFVYAKIMQAREINKKLNKNLPIYPYIKLEYLVDINQSSNTLISMFYSKADVCNAVKFPYDMGVDGVVIWSTSLKMKERCGMIGKFLDNVLGPFASAVVHKARKCSQKQCGGRGRCAAKSIPPFAKCELANQPETICICDKAYTGKRCELLEQSSSAERGDESVASTETLIPMEAGVVGAMKRFNKVTIARFSAKLISTQPTTSPVRMPTKASTEYPSSLETLTTFATTPTPSSTPTNRRTACELSEIIVNANNNSTESISTSIECD